MIVVCQGIREGTHEPLVLVRCGRCNYVFWIEAWTVAWLWVCNCDYAVEITPQPSLAEADLLYPDVALAEAHPEVAQASQVAA